MTFCDPVLLKPGSWLSGIYFLSEEFRTSHIVSGVSQNQPLKVEIKGVQNRHFLEQKKLLSTARMREQWGVSNVLKASLQVFRKRSTLYTAVAGPRRHIARLGGIARRLAGI